METNKPVLVFDVDGVCLIWFANLPNFLEEKGICAENVIAALETNSFLSLEEIFKQGCDNKNFAMLDEYNSSKHVGNLPAFEDKAVEVLGDLSKGFKLIALTCIGSTDTHHNLRKGNLEAIYGEGTFDQVICIDLGESKEDYLREIAKTGEVVFFVDDSAKHIYEAERAGVKGYQFVSRMPLERIDENLDHLCSWSEIHNEARAYLKDTMMQRITERMTIRKDSPLIAVSQIMSGGQVGNIAHAV
ncbi:hypothetical protein [Vibrio crassostreae]|uniref:hypothetical protein n=1 Tax=Vibrio crassostreae TaxID=246167 RepID=UPI001B315562|nr:hypothetical protein [Vibrio crassostreae]